MVTRCLGVVAGCVRGGALWLNYDVLRKDERQIQKPAIPFTFPGACSICFLTNVSFALLMVITVIHLSSLDIRIPLSSMVTACPPPAPGHYASQARPVHSQRSAADALLLPTLTPSGGLVVDGVAAGHPGGGGEDDEAARARDARRGAGGGVRAVVPAGLRGKIGNTKITVVDSPNINAC